MFFSTATCLILAKLLVFNSWVISVSPHEGFPAQHPKNRGLVGICKSQLSSGSRRDLASSLLPFGARMEHSFGYSSILTDIYIHGRGMYYDVLCISIWIWNFNIHIFTLIDPYCKLLQISLHYNTHVCASFNMDFKRFWTISDVCHCMSVSYCSYKMRSKCHIDSTQQIRQTSLVLQFNLTLIWPMRRPLSMTPGLATWTWGIPLPSPKAPLAPAY